MRKVLGITSSQLSESGVLNDEMGFEIYRLLEEGRKHYDEVVLINPAKLYFIFDRQPDLPVVMTENAYLSDLSTLIIRKTSGYEEPISLLARTLFHNGCDLLDPMERFSGSPAGKLMESLKGQIRGTSPETFITFNRSDALRLAVRLMAENRFPLIAKPNRGSRGEMVCRLNSMAETILYIEKFFSHDKYSRSALIFQAFVEAEKEFRVMVLDGVCLGMAEKSATGNQVARNASLGSEFIAAFDPRVADFAIQNTSRKGILGADVLLDARGRLYLLEANRAPQWQAFEKATGINVAACIIQKTWQRIIYAMGKWQ